jgi:hypothetical protein
VRGQKFEKFKVSGVRSIKDQKEHKLYEPPIPRHLLPGANPFFNKKMTEHLGGESKKALTLFGNDSVGHKSSLSGWLLTPGSK